MNQLIFFQVFEGLSVVFETFIVYQYISGLFQSRFTRNKRFCGYVIFCFGLVLLSLVVRVPAVLIIYTLIGLYVLEIVLYKSTISTQVFSTLYFAATMIASEVLCSALVTKLWCLELANTLEYGLSRAVSILIAKLIQIFVVKLSVILTKWKKENSDEIALKFIFPLLVCQLCSIVLAYHVFVLDFKIYEEFDFTAFLSMASIMYMNIIIFWYFDRIKAAYRYKIRSEAMETKLELQNEYYQTLAEHQKETAAIWHDMKKHITLMRSLISNDQKNISSEYLDELEEDMGKRIKIVQTEQPIIGALLTEQLKRADKENIVLDFDIRLESEMKISDIDLCVILGNLFDNAFEACARIEQGREKYIKAEIKQRGQSLLIKIENTNSAKTKTIKHAGRHGFGLNNVRKAVTKYNGQINIDSSYPQFTVTIIIP